MDGGVNYKIICPSDACVKVWEVDGQENDDFIDHFADIHRIDKTKDAFFYDTILKPMMDKCTTRTRIVMAKVKRADCAAQ